MEVQEAAVGVLRRMHDAAQSRAKETLGQHRPADRGWLVRRGAAGFSGTSLISPLFRITWFWFWALALGLYILPLRSRQPATAGCWAPRLMTPEVE